MQRRHSAGDKVDITTGEIDGVDCNCGTLVKRNINKERRYSVPEQGTTPYTPASPEMIRRKLEKVMKHRETFIKSATASFKQFDINGSGTLDLDEIKCLISRLCVNLQLPPIDC